MAKTSRRGFMRGVAASALAGHGPIILGAQNKSGSAKPIMGSGEHTYEVTHDWGELPAGIKYGNTHGVCEDSQARIYVHHTVNDLSESHDSMVVFDRQGRFVKSWGKEFKGGAHGLHIRKEGGQEFLYLCDTRRALVVKTTLDGEEVFTLGYPKESEFYKLDKDGQPATKYSPTNLAIAPNGDIYVGDGYGSSYINQYNSKGGFIRTFGGKGKEPGQLDCPHGITVDLRGPAPRLLVADRANARLQYFTLDGKHDGFVGGVNLPCHFGERHGEFVIPDLGARVTLMDRENKVIMHLGDDSAAKTWGELRKQTRDHFIPGKFVCPHGACFDHEGNILVVEWVEVGRVSRLRKVA
ncbi:MAG TPA: hypothetical protein VMI94_18665 [Bryobacteraceae bacterium]|nr:hypothetical protein [Bryobacteraceae bacterium]